MSLKKEPRLSLGITIAGGRDCRCRLPLYITSVQPVGCLHRDGTIKTGTPSQGPVPFPSLCPPV